MERSTFVDTFQRAAGTRRVRLVLAFGSVVGLLIGIDTALLHLRLDPLGDVHAYYDAGARLNAGMPLYEQAATTNDAEFYRYPPLLAILFRPLALLPFETAALVWEAVLVAAMAGTIALMGVRRTWTWLALGWLAAPVAWSLVIGQAQVAVTYLMTLGTPFGLALAGHLKVFPALAAIWWLGRREWRQLGRFAAWALGFLLVSFVLEPAGTVAYLSFPDLEQVGEVRNLALFDESPILWLLSAGALGLAALVLAPTKAGWVAAVALAVLVTPRLLMYQLMALLAAVAPPPERRDE